MDGNKDEALRCVKLAESALASGDKQKALKYIKIAQRLDPSVPIEGCFVDSEKLNTPNGIADEDEISADQAKRTSSSQKQSREAPNGTQSYNEEHAKVIREIKKNRDYYAILGVQKTCSVEEIRKAYRKLSLKVHPDKNKAPGAEEAFKSVSRAFKCLSDEESRRSYDQTGAVEDHEYNEQYGNGMRRRAGRRSAAASGFYYEDEIDPDEIFRSFFFGTQNNVFHANNFHRARGMGPMGTQQRREQPVQGGVGLNLAMLMPLAWILLLVFFAFLPSHQPEYSLQKSVDYPILKVTEKYGVQYFVKRDFDVQFPRGSSSRDNLEYNVVNDYRQYLGQYCNMEMQRRRWVRDYPTPNCDKLRGLMVA